MDDTIISVVQLALCAVLLFPASAILKKAGYSPWLVLLGLIPLVNIILFLVFAFSDWPRNRVAREPAGARQIVD